MADPELVLRLAWEDALAGSGRAGWRSGDVADLLGASLAALGVLPEPVAATVHAEYARALALRNRSAPGPVPAVAPDTPRPTPSTRLLALAPVGELLEVGGRRLLVTSVQRWADRLTVVAVDAEPVPANVPGLLAQAGALVLRDRLGRAAVLRDTRLRSDGVTWVFDPLPAGPLTVAPAREGGFDPLPVDVDATRVCARRASRADPDAWLAHLVDVIAARSGDAADAVLAEVLARLTATGVRTSGVGAVPHSPGRPDLPSPGVVPLAADLGLDVAGGGGQRLLLDALVLRGARCSLRGTAVGSAPAIGGFRSHWRVVDDAGRAHAGHVTSTGGTGGLAAFTVDLAPPLPVGTTRLDVTLAAGRARQVAVHLPAALR